MKVSLIDAGKRFNRDWIFRHLSYNFEEANSYAIIGPNGSGKSTLLQVLSGAMEVSEGRIEFSRQASVDSRQSNAPGRDPIVSSEEIFNYVSISAPYLEVVEEMTLREFLNFHARFKPLLPSASVEMIVSEIGLSGAINKQIRHYSSGMKQRVKIGQAIFSDTPFLLLDEPCTNLDEEGIALYHQLIGRYCGDRLVVVSSNDEIEYRFCSHRINIGDYKK